MKKILTLLFILISIYSCTNDSTDKGTRASDIEFIKTELPNLHIDLFRNFSEDVFLNELDLLKNEADSLTDIIFSLRLQEIITKLGDSHTNINYPRYLDKKNSYPYKLYWLKDGLYVLAVHKDYENILGKKLLSINNVLVKDILLRFEKIIVHDNDAIIKHRVPNLIASKDILDFLKITNDSLNIFEFFDSKENIKLQLKTANNINDLKNIVKLEPTKLPLSLQPKPKMFWLVYLEDQNIMYAQYNKCWGKELEHKYGDKDRAQFLPSFSEFSNALIDSIKENKPSKLIFDIRYNSGGSSLQGTELVEKLSKLEDLKQKGKIFVIVGRQTFSSAVINAMNFKDKTEAIIIGEQTSGAPNHFGEVRGISLPSTKIRLNYSTKYFRYTDSIGNTIEPDFVVEQTLDDYLNGVDPILEYIYNYKN
ncbi:MAG: hypothetical protein GY936_04935 [Ignavibacteriae bacterium]|nr:hypothetical protein [Ignavibacteriota bacterium]